MKVVCRFPHRRIIFLITLVFLSLHIHSPEGAYVLALSIEDERLMGEKFLASVREQFEFVEDDFANQYINDLGQYLVRPLETKAFPFRFYIIKERDLNAFAAPGGHIFIFTGLIEYMDKADELAGVICHEMGHVAARHISERIERSKKVGLATIAGILVGVLIGGEAGGALMMGSQAAGIQKELSYSRDDERQADQMGFKYMDISGFDPSEMITTQKKLLNTRWLGPGRMPAYLLTHPGGTERISNIESMLSGHKPKPENSKTAEFRRLFPLLRTTLAARYLEPQEAERLLQTELDKDPDSVSAHFGMGILCNERSEYSRAIHHFRKALEGEPGSVTILTNLGESYLRKGQYGEAIQIFENVLSKDDHDKAALFLLADSYQSLEEYDKAIRLYTRLTFMEPVKDEVFYNLGVSYGRVDRLALAHYNFGLYFKRLGKTNKARFHFQKAEEFSGNDPLLARRIREAVESLSASRGR